MRIHPAPQGSEAWQQARLGLPTASNFHRICTPTGKPSSQAGGYMHELLAERLLGLPAQADATDWMERGKITEERAVAFYEMTNSCDTQAVGFCTLDDGSAGATPDRLVGEAGLLEIKCPSAAVHIGYLLGDDAAKYRVQVQGQLWVTGREWCAWLSFCPELPPALVRHARDEDFIALLADAVTEFNARLNAAHQQLAALIGLWGAA